ncbi:MAG: cytosolic factor, phosphatidylinositol/phosphatidylcholine transfer protein [Sporothrix epigloea]
MAATANGGMELDPKYDNYDYPIVSPNDQSGHPGHLTAEQQAQVHQLRLLLEAQGCTKRLDTLTLLRFLRARKFDVNLAMKMFVDTEAWRKETGLDDLVATWEYPEKEKIFEYYPQYYHKTDRDGRPVYIEALGNIDLTAMYKITSAERMLTNLAVEYERLADPRLPACSRKAGHLLETCCTIMDMKGVGISRAPQVYSYIKQASGMSQNYYPERLGRFYLLNAPWGFSTVWSIIKGWLDPVTVAKIHILGGSYQKELFQQVSPENLPKQFGGSCECPGGCGFSDMGPWREPEWYKPASWENKDGAAAAPAAGAAAPPAAGTTATEGITLEAPGAAAEEAAIAKETAAA